MNIRSTKLSVFKTIKVNDVDSTDGISLSHIGWFMHNLLTAEGKKTNHVVEILHNSRKGRPIEDREYNILYKENAIPQPIKITANTAYLMLETSVFFIPRIDVSYVLNQQAVDEIYDLILIMEMLPTITHLSYGGKKLSKKELIQRAHEYFAPIEGAEILHHTLNLMEVEEIGIYAAESSMKKMLEVANELDEENKIYEIPNTAIRKIDETFDIDNKHKYELQIQQLLTSEISDDAKIVIDNLSISGAEAKFLYKKILAKRIADGEEENKQKLLNNIGEAEYKYMLEEFRKTTGGFYGNPYVKEMISSQSEDDVIKPKYDLNFPGIVNKFESLYLSFLEKTHLKKLVHGTIFSLLPEIGFPVLESNGKIISRDELRRSINPKITYRKLRSRVKDSDGIIYSEVIVSKAFAKLFGLKIGDTIPDLYLNFFGVSIPTIDRSTMFNMKIVDFIDACMGNSLVVPTALVINTRWDYNLDAIYAQVPEVTFIDDKLSAFGQYAIPVIEKVQKNLEIESERKTRLNTQQILTELSFKKIIEEGIQHANDEYLIELLDNPIVLYELKSVGLGPKFSDPRVRSSLKRIIGKNANLLPRFDETQVISNLLAYAEGRFVDIIPITNGEANNLILKLQHSLINHETNTTSISLNVFEEIRNKFTVLGINSSNIREPYSFGNKSKLEDENLITQNFHSTITSFNLIFQDLAGKKFNKSRIYLFEEDGFNVSIDKNGWLLDAKRRRVNHFFSQLQRLLVKNSPFLTLFNINKDTITILNLVLASGKTFEFGVYLINQPIIKDLVKILTENNNNLVKNQYYSLNEIRNKLYSKYRINPKKDRVFSTLTMTIEEQEKLLLHNIPSPTSDVQLYALHTVLEAFKIANELSDYIIFFGRVSIRGKSFSVLENNKDRIENIMNPSYLFNTTEILESNPHLKIKMEACKNSEMIDKKFFIVESDIFKEIQKLAYGNINKINSRAYKGISKIRTQLNVFLTMKAVREVLPQKADMEVLFTPDLQNDINKLKSHYLFLGNSFLKVIDSVTTKHFKKGPFVDRTLYLLNFNTRSQLLHQTVEDIMDGFVQLFYSDNELARSVSERMIQYLLVKDGFLYKNNSFIHLIEPYILDDIGIFKAINTIRQNFTGTPSEFQEIFGMSKDQFISEFLYSFLKYSDNQTLLYKIKKTTQLNTKQSEVFKITIDGETYNVSQQKGFITHGKNAKARHSAPIAFATADNSGICIISQVKIGNNKINERELRENIYQLLGPDGLIFGDSFEYVRTEPEGSSNVFNFYLTEAELKEFESHNIRLHLENEKEKQREIQRARILRQILRDRQRGKKG